MQLFAHPEKKPDEFLVAQAFKHGLHRGGRLEVDRFSREVLGHMDDPHNYSVKVLGATVGLPVRFELIRGNPHMGGGRRIAVSPEVKTEEMFKFNMMFAEVLRKKGVNCNQMAGHFRRMHDLGLTNLLRIADEIASKIH
jgi:hypothetical protein